MDVEARALITIVGMALATLFTRLAGLWLMARLPKSKTLERGLEYLPGTILVALIAPAVISGGWADALAAGATAFVALRTRSLLLALGIGVSLVWILRRVI